MTPRPLVFFDLETAGLEPDAEIIQLAAIAIEWPTFQELGTFERKIQFDESRAHPKALEVNHYDRAVWAREAEGQGTVLMAFSQWLRPFTCIPMTSKAGKPYKLAQMVGYNSEGFDSERIQRAFKNNGIFYPAHYRTLDALQLAAWDALDTGLVGPSLKLTDVCERMKLSTTGAHDALVDVRMTIALVKWIMLCEV